MKVTAVTATVASALVLMCAVAGRAQQITPIQPAAQTWESCEEMHDNYVRRFERTAGFGPARMMTPDMLDRSGTLDLGRRQYKVENIELVGLLSEGSPVVYVMARFQKDAITTSGLSNHGSRFSPARPTKRALTDYEKQSIEMFRSGRGIASTPNASGTLECSGALRAKQACLSCHENQKAGDLLGAFSYRLRESKN